MTNSSVTRQVVREYFLAVLRHWCWLLATVVLTGWDLIERVRSDWYRLPGWALIAGGSLCLTIAQFMAYAELKRAKENEAEVQARNFDKAHQAISELTEALETGSHGVIIEVKAATSGEHVYPYDTVASGPAHHNIVIELELAVRHRDSRESGTLEIVDCHTDISDATLVRLSFLGDPTSPVDRPPGRYRNFAPGEIRPIIANAVYSLPVSQTHIPETRVTGHLEFVDNRATRYSVAFTAEVVKNKVGSEP